MDEVSKPMATPSGSPRRAFPQSGISRGTLSRSRAFTLLEMLIVLAIAIVLFSFIAPAVTSISQGNALTRGGQNITDTLLLAVEEAMTRNRAMEVRLIRIPSDSGESLAYRGVQVWGAKESSGTFTSLTPIMRLPRGVVIAESLLLSPLLQSPNALSGKVAVNGVERDYTAFVILANGSLKGGQPAQSYLTVLLEKDAGTDSAPSNYFSIYLNPATGKVRTFRP